MSFESSFIDAYEGPAHNQSIIIFIAEGSEKGSCTLSIECVSAADFAAARERHFPNVIYADYGLTEEQIRRIGWMYDDAPQAGSRSEIMQSVRANIALALR